MSTLMISGKGGLGFSFLLPNTYFIIVSVEDAKDRDMHHLHKTDKINSYSKCIFLSQKNKSMDIKLNKIVKQKQIKHLFICYIFH
jgi:hypothetical protein